METKSEYIETIRINNGSFESVERHLNRLNNTIKEVYRTSSGFYLSDNNIPSIYREGIVKCRILYNDHIEKIEYIPYLFRNIKSLKLIEANELQYNKKYADRNSLNELLSRRNNCDEILITQNGFITDTSYSNVVFFDGENYVTPSTFLLNGIRRQQLIESGRIMESIISLKDIKSFKKVFLINSMINLGEQEGILTENII